MNIMKYAGINSGAQSINSSIVPANAIETTSRIVNEIYLDFISMDSSYLTSSDSLILNNLAHLNAYYYGHGVFTARALLNLFIPEPPVNNDFRFEEKEQEENIFINSWSIFPNPTENNFTISLKCSDKEVSELIISDITGRVVLRKKVTGNYFKFSANDFSAGVYTITINNSLHTFNTKKLVLLK